MVRRKELWNTGTPHPNHQSSIPSYCKKNIPAPITRTFFFLPSSRPALSAQEPIGPSPDLGTAKARDAEPAPSACRGHEFWQTSQGVWPRPRCASAQGDPSPSTPRDADLDAIRSPFSGHPGAPGQYSSGASTSAPPSTRRCAASEWPCSGRIVERRKTSGRGVEDERRIVTSFGNGLQEGNQRRGACTSSWILLEGFTDLLCFWGGFSGFTKSESHSNSCTNKTIKESGK